jgi:hypothetical protein
MNNLYIILFLLIIILILIICSIIRFSYQNKGIISGGVAGLCASNRRPLVRSRSRSNSDDSFVTANYHPPQLPDSIIQYMEKNDRDTNKLDMQIKQLKKQIENKAYNDGEPNEFLKTTTEELKDLCNNDDFDYYYITYGKEKGQTIDKKTLKRLLKEHKNIPNGFPVMKKKIKKGGGKTFEDFKKFLADDIAESRDLTTHEYTYKPILHYTDEIEKWFKQKAIEERGWSGFAYSFIATTNTNNRYFDKIVRLLSQVLFDKMQFISQNGDTRPPTEIIESMSGILEIYFNWLNKKDNDPEFQYLQFRLGDLNPSPASSKFDQFKEDLLYIINFGIKQLRPNSNVECKSKIINGIITWFTREKDNLERIDNYIITTFVDKLMQLVQYKDFATANIIETQTRIQSLIIDPIIVEIKAYFDWLIKENNKLSVSYIQFILSDDSITLEEKESKITKILVYSDSEDYKNNLLKHHIEQFNSNRSSNSTQVKKNISEFKEELSNILKDKNKDIGISDKYTIDQYIDIVYNIMVNVYKWEVPTTIKQIIFKLLISHIIGILMENRTSEHIDIILSNSIGPINGTIQKYFDWLIKPDDDPELLYIQEVLDDNDKYPTQKLKFAEIIEIIELEKVNEIKNAIMAKQAVREKNIMRMFTAVDEVDLGYRVYGDEYKNREQEEEADVPMR